MENIDRRAALLRLPTAGARRPLDKLPVEWSRVRILSTSDLIEAYRANVNQTTRRGRRR
jgi:hypothetical protein